MPPAPVNRPLAYVSHAAEDNRPPGRAWADWVVESLQQFPVPRNLAGRPTPFGPIPPRLAPVFKPQREQDAKLTGEWRDAVTQSRLLIVVCSPAAARSEVVAEEIRQFKKLGRDRVVALVVAGEPDAADPEQECFPETLKYEVRRDGTLDREWRVHPILIDVRREQRLAQGRRLLAAAAMGVPPEAVAADDSRTAATDAPAAGEKRRSGFAATVAVISLLAAAGLAWMAYQAQENAKAAQAARQRSDELIVFLQRNLREKLAPMGRIELLAEVNERVTEHLERVARETSDPVALSGLADSLRDTAAILEQRGNLAGALEAAMQAAQARHRIADSPNAPADTALQLIRDQLLVAQIYLGTGQHRDALGVAEQARATAVALSRKRLGDEQAELALAQTHAQVGDALLELNKTEEAERAYTSARESARQLASRQPQDAQVQETLASITERFAKLRERLGDVPGAIVELKEWQRVLVAGAAGAPNDSKVDTALAGAQMRLGNLLLVQRQYGAAAAEFRKATDATERVARVQPANKIAQLAYVSAMHRLGMTLAYDASAKAEAIAVLQRAIDHINQHFPGDAHLQASTARTEIQRFRDSLAAKQP